jgi:opacity protein-like surface antigen
MKRMLRGAAIGLAVAMSAQAAQAQSNLSLGIGGGAVVPTGSLADVGKTGWNATLSARLKPAPSPIGFQLDGFYNRFAFDGIDGHSSILGASANALFALPGVVAHPYLIGGLGVYNMKATVGDVSGSDTKFGFNGGLGVDVGVGPARLYAEGRLHGIMKGTVDSQTLEEKTAYMVPLTVGLRWALR